MTKYTSSDEKLFNYVKRSGDWNAFSERYFQLPMSGTWFTPEDRVEQYELMFDMWNKLGGPSEEFEVIIDESPVSLRVSWDAYYGGDPTFLLPHGFRTMPWMEEFLSPQVTKAVAVTGTGSGKTCGVAVRALTYCALYPGYKFLNIAPTQTQADLALGEIEKWAGNSEFSKFIVQGRGVHNLWVERDYPTVTIQIVEGHPSTFVCQTVGRDTTRVLGGERDWINADEAQLLYGIEESQEILATRLRGTRSTGIPRSTKLTWITNPGHNPELVSLMEQYRDLAKKGDKSVLVMEEVATKDNIYLTQRQKDEQAKVLHDRAQRRWHGGQMSAVMENSELGEAPLEKCHSLEFTKWAEEHAKSLDGVGIMEYERPYKAGHTYVVAGDVGKSSIGSLNSQNVPCVMVFDVTNFLERPMEMSAFYWFDGKDDYKTFISKFIHAMIKYQARGYYDAGNIQSAFEDLDSRFSVMPTTPITFAGLGTRKRWALAIAIQLMNDGQFRWPRIKAFWHQARIFEYSRRNIADDIIATLLVFCLALQIEGTLWNRFLEVYKWDPENDEYGQLDAVTGDEIYEEAIETGMDRYERFI